MVLSRYDLLEHVRIQVGFLQKSGREFDEGDESESVRLAVAIRVLVYNSTFSTSLLKQLGVQDELKFLDTAMPPIEPPTPGLLIKRFDGGLAYLEMSRDGARYRAPLDDNPPVETFGPQPFQDWWNRPIIGNGSHVLRSSSS
jgi:hypothetical protein